MRNMSSIISFFVGVIVATITTSGLFVAGERFNKWQKPQTTIQETTIRIVEDTLSVDDSRVVSRTTIGKQSFLIFKLGHHYQVFEEKK